MFFQLNSHSTLCSVYLVALDRTSTLVGNSNDPPQKYCILDVIKRLINQSRLVKTGRNWSKLVETGPNWSKLSKLVETCNGLPCSKTNRTFIWTFLNLIFLLSDTSNHGWHSMFYESLIILNISTLNFSEGVPASVLGSWANTEKKGLGRLWATF